MGWWQPPHPHQVLEIIEWNNGDETIAECPAHKSSKTILLLLCYKTWEGRELLFFFPLSLCLRSQLSFQSLPNLSLRLDPAPTLPLLNCKLDIIVQTFCRHLQLTEWILSSSKAAPLWSSPFPWMVSESSGSKAWSWALCWVCKQFLSGLGANQLPSLSNKIPKLLLHFSNSCSPAASALFQGPTAFY